MLDHVENYLKWLKDNMTETEITPNLIEVTTPFLDRHNDYTQIYLEKIENNQYKVTDLGYTVNDLLLSGFELTTEKRKALFRNVLARLGLKYNDDKTEIYLTSSLGNLPAAQHSVMQGMLDINDLFYTNSANVKSMFYEDVKSFLDINEIYYTRNINIRGVSGLEHTFDYSLQKNKNNPTRFVRVLNEPNRGNIERFIFSWDDVLPQRDPDDKFIVILNDIVHFNKNLVDSFDKYKIIPFMWSKREEKKELLA